jgi:hypothetical protein
MRTLVAIFCLAALPAHGFEFFPHDFRFAPPVADPAEPRLFMSRLEVKRNAGAFSAAFLGVGHDFGLLRRQSAIP